MKYLLRIETDDDFSIRYGKIVYGNDDTLLLESVASLDEIEVLGPFGSPHTEATKDWEWHEALKAIQTNPDEPFRNTGGNRGVEWTPVGLTEEALANTPEELRINVEKLRIYDHFEAFSTEISAMHGMMQQFGDEASKDDDHLLAIMCRLNMDLALMLLHTRAKIEMLATPAGDEPPPDPADWWKDKQ